MSPAKGTSGAQSPAKRRRVLVAAPEPPAAATAPAEGPRRPAGVFTPDEVLELVRRTARRELEFTGAPFPRKSAEVIARKVIAGLGLIAGAEPDVDEAAG